jgi:GT2 family glycosyltransferase
MAAPRFSVIVPVARFEFAEPVLASLRHQPAPAGGVEVIVAEGSQPSLQRNVAVRQAVGEVLVFLDNDCAVGPGFWEELERVLARGEVEIVGGPACLRPDSTSWERILHATLTHVLVVGTVSARYAPRGVFRPATQTDLILCNLAVRREIFARIGTLSADLYPNEENEWLDRAHAVRVGAYYDPDLRVYRPQRASPGRLLVMLLRYGIGRTRQFRVSHWRPTFHQVLPLILLAALGAIFAGGLEVPFLVLWLLAALILGATCRGLSVGERIVAGLLGPLVPLTYAVGQLVGWFILWRPAPRGSGEIVLRDETGKRIADSDATAAADRHGART